MKVIIINKTNYKEKDAIVSAISETGFLSFKVRGLLSPTSAFIWMNNPLTVAEVEFIENARSKYPVLKNAKMVDSSLSTSLALDKMLAINLVSEVINRVVQDEEKHLLFNDIINFVNFVKKEEDLLFAELIFIAKVIKVIGASLNVNECVYCGSKKGIVSFSFEEGGFICRNCLSEETTIDLSASQMLLVRFIFNASDFSYVPNDRVKLEDMIVLMGKLQQYIYDSIGVNLSTITLILKNIK